LRFPGVRLTVRRLMIFVVIVAVLLGGLRWGIRLRQRRDDALREAARHRHAAAFYQNWIVVYPNFVAHLKKDGYRGDIRRDFPTPEDHRTRRDQHLVLERKYRQAAARPWLPIEPDPPSLDTYVAFPRPSEP
jgi:hypothetical protein